MEPGLEALGGVAMRVLVTGATGILGSWLTKALVDAGHSVACLVRDDVPDSNFRRLKLERRVTTFMGRLESYEDVARALHEHETEVCYHLGAQAIVTLANREPLGTLESNVRGSWNVLEAARRHKPLRRLVFASSDKAYGELSTLPYTEEMPLAGRNPYDASKACADILAQSYARTYGMPIAISRCGNIYGGGDLNWSRVVPSTVKAVLEGKRPIIRSDGSPVRDYIYVKDAVSAYLSLGSSTEVGAFNFGNESPVSVIDLVQTILRAMRSQLKPIVRNEAANEIPKQWLSAEKARRLLGWKPLWGLGEGLAETVAWYRRNGMA